LLISIKNQAFQIDQENAFRSSVNLATRHN